MCREGHNATILFCTICPLTLLTLPWSTRDMLTPARIVLLGWALPLLGWVPCRRSSPIMFRLIRWVAVVRRRPRTRLKQVSWQVPATEMFDCTTPLILGPVSILVTPKLGHRVPSRLVLWLYLVRSLVTWVRRVCRCLTRRTTRRRLARRPPRSLSPLSLWVASAEIFPLTVSPLQQVLLPIVLPCIVLARVIRLPVLALHPLRSVRTRFPTVGSVLSCSAVLAMVPRTSLLARLVHLLCSSLLKVPSCLLGSPAPFLFPLLLLPFLVLRLVVFLLVDALVSFLGESLLLGGREGVPPRPLLLLWSSCPSILSCWVSCLLVGCRVGLRILRVVLVVSVVVVVVLLLL